LAQLQLANVLVVVRAQAGLAAISGSAKAVGARPT